MIDFLARQMWLRLPIGAKPASFFADFHEFPYQAGASPNMSNINDGLDRRSARLLADQVLAAREMGSPGVIKR